MTDIQLKRGRPATVDENFFVDVVMSFKERIIIDSKIISRNNSVWSDLSEKFDDKLLPSSLFVMIMTNKYGISDRLLNRQKNSSISKKIEDGNLSKSSIMTDSDISYDEANCSLDASKPELKFDFLILKEEFANIVEQKYYQSSKGGKRHGQKRLWCVFRPGLYQDYFIKRIWETTHAKCGFLFDHSYVNMDQSSGTITAHCKCGSQLMCKIERFLNSQNYNANCKITLGSGQCGKPYLRNPIRQRVGEELETRHVEAYKAEKANDLMTRENDPEPPIIPLSGVLYNVKKEHLQEQYMTKNPIESLKILKYGECANCIEDIGFDPFYVQYSTNECLQTYKKLCAKNDKVCVCIDSTGGLVKKVNDKKIFMHALALNCPEGQFTITHMLSEVSHSQAICNWLKMWRRSGAPTPDICITDWSIALLNGVTNALTKFEHVDEYAEALYLNDTDLPQTFIRIDVAHILKKYSQFCKALRKPIKTFYLACIGQLILCLTRSEAERIIQNIFTVSLSETDGNLLNGKPSPCEQAKMELMELVAGNNVSLEKNEIHSEPNDESNERAPIGKGKNIWFRWGSDIKASVRDVIDYEKGDRINAYMFEGLSDYMLKDITLLPLWTNIMTDEFGCKGVNASSAPIEGEFGKLKNQIFKKSELPQRVDSFVRKHVQYLMGKSKLLDAKVDATRRLNNVKDKSPRVGLMDECDIIEDCATRDCQQDDTHEEHQDRTAENEGYNDEKNVPEVIDAQIDTECPACRNRHMPDGAHSCVLCKKSVHAIAGCSEPYDEEGFGQKRVCVLCWNNRDFKNNIALNDFDNWKNMGVINEKSDMKKRKRGKVSPGKENRKRRALYLGEKKSLIQDIITIRKHQSIPIIRNGHDKTLNSLKLRGKCVFMKNTCAFDSVFELMLAASHDFEEVKEMVLRLSEKNMFFQMICHVNEHGLGSHSYLLRGKILQEHYPLTEHPVIPNTYIIDCEDNVGSLSRHVFTNHHSSYTEVMTCNKGCEASSKSYVAYDVPADDLIQHDIRRLITKYNNERTQSKCKNAGCVGTAESQQIIGDIVLFDVFYTSEVPAEISLAEICTKFDIPGDSGHKLRLLGIVDYHNSNVKRSEIDLGHYTAIVRRRDNVWLRYNDLSPSQPSKCSIRTRVQPALMVLLKRKENTP